MSLSMSAVALPTIRRMLGNLNEILVKAQSHCETKKIDPTALLQARLFPDMLALPRQIQIACDGVKFAVARLGSAEAPKFEDNEATFDELRARIANTLAFVNSVSASAIDGTETKTITIPMRDKSIEMPGQAYLMHFVLPNLYFHVATAYAILRHNGVEIGKRDFLGNPG